MTKTGLIEAIAQKSGEQKSASSKMLEAFIQTVTEELGKGETINIAGLGTLQVSERAARKGRNPHTGEDIMIPAKKVPSMKFGQSVKNAVMGK